MVSRLTGTLRMNSVKSLLDRKGQVKIWQTLPKICKTKQTRQLESTKLHRQLNTSRQTFFFYPKQWSFKFQRRFTFLWYSSVYFFHLFPLPSPFHLSFILFSCVSFQILYFKFQLSLLLPLHFNHLRFGFPIVFLFQNNFLLQECPKL